MLFDLRGRGRRRTVQVIYLGLALLLGGGLVLFGIGSSGGGSGGIVDAVIGDGNGGSATEEIDERIEAAVAKTRETPRKPEVWAELARLRHQRAGINGISADRVTYNDEGKERLSEAADAWERYLALDPKQPDPSLARVMAQAYSQRGLNEPVKALRAFEIVTAAEDPPNTNLFQQLAQLAYQAGDTRTGDLASDRAVELAPKDQKKLLRTTLQQIKTQAASQSAQNAPAPTPSN
ncbi:MAG: tetratricopeptide repeat protein [Solirubrobacteraceae bacterium]